MKGISINFGRGRQSGSLPRAAQGVELTGRPMPGLTGPLRELRSVLGDPVDAPPLREAASEAEDAIITVSDHTRYYAYEKWLPEVLDQLNQAGLRDERIRVYVSSGTHRNMTDAEKRERFGDRVCNRVEVLDHDCDALDRMMKVGKTDYGTTVYVDERVYNSDFVLITGAITYHYFAGYSGGRKSLIPGVCARSTILENHVRAIDRDTGDFARNVEPGVLTGNPVHEDMHEVAMLIRPNYCINAILNADRELAWFGAGDYAYVHRIGAEWLDDYNKVEIERQYAVAIVGAGGYPKDLTLFQAHKSLRHSVPALSPGATIVWLAECSEGEGPAGMADWRNLTLAEAKARVADNPSLVSFCALSLKKITDRFNVQLVTSLDPQVARAWGFTPHAALESALAAASAAAGAENLWLVAPDMSNLLPVVKPPESEVEDD